MKKIFAANWKLNKSPEQARDFINQFKKQTSDFENFFQSREILIFPQAFSLESVSALCQGTEIAFGPQNIYSENSGAFTGENSAEIAYSMRSRFALVGHSERRELFKESNNLLNLKNSQLQKLGINPVYCIGESLQQRETNQTLSVCFEQLEKGLDLLNKNKRIIIAYEPIWSIGTGKVASVQQVTEIHFELNKKILDLGFTDFQLLYGGSVKPENANELINIPHVDGFLIGGASLEVSSFLKICLSSST